MAVCVIVLNKILIFEYRINGAALATLITIFIFSTIKIWYIKSKMNMHPFTTKTFLVLGLIVVLFVAFYFIEFTFHPVINIIFKSLLITFIYLIAVIKLKISADINELTNKYLIK